MVPPKDVILLLSVSLSSATDLPATTFSFLRHHLEGPAVSLEPLSACKCSMMTLLIALFKSFMAIGVLGSLFNTSCLLRGTSPQALKPAINFC